MNIYDNLYCYYYNKYTDEDRDSVSPSLILAAAILMHIATLIRLVELVIIDDYFFPPSVLNGWFKYSVVIFVFLLSFFIKKAFYKKERLNRLMKEYKQEKSANTRYLYKALCLDISVVIFLVVISMHFS